MPSSVSPPPPPTAVASQLLAAKDAAAAETRRINYSVGDLISPLHLPYDDDDIQLML